MRVSCTERNNKQGGGVGWLLPGWARLLLPDILLLLADGGPQPGGRTSDATRRGGPEGRWTGPETGV